MSTVAAVKRPDASAARRWRIRNGCRLPWPRIDSRRSQTIRTGLPLSRAASSSRICREMSSRPPKAPPMLCCTMRSRSSGSPSAACGLSQVFLGPLRGDVERQTTVRVVFCKARLRREERMLDESGAVLRRDHDGRSSERALGTPAADLALGYQVWMRAGARSLRMNDGRIRRTRKLRVEQRCRRREIESHATRTLARSARGGRNDEGKHVGCAANEVARKHRLVRFEKAEAIRSTDVRGGEHTNNARHGERAGASDAENACARHRRSHRGDVKTVARESASRRDRPRRRSPCRRRRRARWSGRSRPCACAQRFSHGSHASRPALSTALTIFVYPVQRQMLPTSASRIAVASALGGKRLAAMIIPGVQKPH